MITFIRSLTELMLITESRENSENIVESKEINTSTIDSGQRRRYIRSQVEKETELPNIPVKTRQKWNKSKEIVYKILKELDYNNQIQSSYELTLQARQSKSNYHDAA